MQKTKGIERAQFLTGLAAAGLAATVLPAGRADAAQGGSGQGSAARSGSGQATAARGGSGQGTVAGGGFERARVVRGGPRHHGVVYTVGEGETPGTAFSAARMRKDVRAIRDELHADTVDVTGDGVDRLTATAAEAVEQGLRVWLQPTLGDAPERDILEHIAETGRFAERLRRHGAAVDFSVGCEFWLFVPGIVPGDTVLEHIRNLLDGKVDHDAMQRRLDRFTAKAAAVGRSVYRGRLAYAASQDDRVDWRLFDIVGINYYSYFTDRADYVRELSRYLRWGKPLAITEFGTCTYVGAPQAGGMGWDVVDHDKKPEEIKGDLVRSERTQAAYLTQLLDAFSSVDLYAAMAFEFVTADAPHRPDDPRHDLDMASYSLTKTIKDRPDDPASGWHWEPKEAFHALARRYRAARTGHERTR
ncbi:abortive phage infection protein [Streptomyces sp. SP2-10]|uniref:abortive phage infection protein n=1 Tax=Streptomyces sp. SP2-10 TaxID=2873385 RepID=UPI001CA725F7|nr:abortive phage infection protein [Streptomyces sp. SP2-10]MBY8840261.1 abortive phage infection protein [Streptomyces sp. SP2-10]